MRPLLHIGFFLIIFLNLCSNCLSAQEQLGIKLDNYAGINSVLLNPALPATSPYRWDVNLFSFAGFFDNSYAFIENAGVPDLRRFEDVRSRPQLIENPESMPVDPLILDFHTNGVRKWASGTTSILGPSMMLNLDSDWGFGIFTQFRTVGQIRKIPVNLDYYPYDATPVDQQITATPFKGAMMAWGEMGFNVSKKIDTWYGVMAIGGTLKVIGGLEAAYGSVNDDFKIIKRGTDTLQIEGVNSEFGFTTTNADIYNNSTPMQGINGYGAGLDMGIQIMVEGIPEKYQWRAGAAIVDLGRVSFSNNAQAYRVDSEEMFNLVFSSYESLTNPLAVASKISEEALGDASAAAYKNNFGIWLPAALNLHGDYAFTDHIYLGAAFTQRIPLGRHSVDRNNVFGLVPRIESRWFAAVLPVSLLNYQQVHLGLAARIGFLTIGTDNLGSYFQQKNLTGTDFYLALKLNPFKLKGGGGRNGGNGQVRCYDF